MSRRQFIQVGGMSVLLAACAPSRLPASGSRPLRSALAAPSAGGERLLVNVFLRGGADGLHLLPATGDRGYARLRARLALTQTLPFAKDFSLHPEMAALGTLVERGQLAAVPAAGSRHSTRSHFAAQDQMELGGPEGRVADGGWLTRALRGPGGAGTFASLALASQQPLSLRGSGAFAIADPESFGLPRMTSGARATLEGLYQSGEDPVGRAGAHALSALADFEARVGRPARFARRPPRPRAELTTQAEQLLALDRAGLGVRVACLESGGWDTHAAQGAESGPLAERIRDLAAGLAKLADGLGEHRDWLAVVMTEFGRTVAPNGSRGTDHGHGSLMLVAGPRVRGGVYGDWAGLSRPNLYEGRDVPVLCDFRNVLHEVMTAHLGSAPPADTFPGFSPEPLGIVA